MAIRDESESMLRMKSPLEACGTQHPGTSPQSLSHSNTAHQELTSRVALGVKSPPGAVPWGCSCMRLSNNLHRVTAWLQIDG